MMMKMMKVQNIFKFELQINRIFCFVLEMRDFIVDDDDEINNGFDYRKELQETLKTNFRFDKEK
jgi:hypothetical protein